MRVARKYHVWCCKNLEPSVWIAYFSVGTCRSAGDVHQHFNDALAFVERGVWRPLEHMHDVFQFH